MSGLTDSGHSYHGVVASSHNILEKLAVTERNTKEWLDLVALVAVVGGLVMVAYEIRQANTFAKAETENSIYEGWETLSMSEIESGISALRAKAMEHPENLTTAEHFELAAHLTAVISLYQRNGRMFYEYDLATDPMYSDVGGFYFHHQYAREWFDRSESWIRKETPELADEIRNYIDSTPLD
jgi:hypothetical protein